MINYHLLSIENYINALVNLISSFEGHIPQVKDIGDGMATIGYGYTFNRSNNLALWTAAGIALTDSERTALQNIDNASNNEKTNIALTQFTHNLTKDEACQLLKQTYQQYESPADELGMPISSERVAFVSLTYNRGVDAVHKKMKAFYAAMQAGNRAEAWFEIRYRSQTTNPKYVNGIANRRYSESQMFGLYDSGAMTDEEAKEVLRMYTIHKIEIGAYESRYAPPATINTEIELARIYLGANLNIDGEIIVGAGLPTYAYMEIDGDDPILLGTAQNDLIFGEAGDDGIAGMDGNDIIYGGEGNDTIIGGKGNDILEGGAGNDDYIFQSGDGNDKINDSEGTNRILWEDSNGNRHVEKTFYKTADAQWKSADGTTSVNKNSPYKMVFQDGTTIELGESINSFDINLKDIPANPILLVV